MGNGVGSETANINSATPEGGLGAPGILVRASPAEPRKALELAGRIENQGWGLIACPNTAEEDNVGLAQAVALSTRRIAVSTSIANIYRRHPADYAATAVFLHALTGGRFIFGVGVGHSLPDFNGRFDVSGERPVRDTGGWLDAYRDALAGREGPPIMLGALRSRMVDLAIERFDGLIVANGSRRALFRLARELPGRRDTPFTLGAHTFVCVSEEGDRSLEALRHRLASYMNMPNYRAYWREVGFEDEVVKSEEIISRYGSAEQIAAVISEDMVDDCCIRGSARECSAGLREMTEAGIAMTVVMPVSPSIRPRDGVEGSDHEALMSAFDPLTVNAIS